MKVRNVFIAGVCFAVGVAAVYFGSEGGSTSDVDYSHASAAKSGVDSIGAETAAPPANGASAKTSGAILAINKNKNDDPNTKELPREITPDVAMKQEIMRVADIYQEKSKYPPYSIAIDESQADLLNPNESFEVSRDYSEGGLPGGIGIKTSKYRYSAGEPIEVIAFLRGGDDFLSLISGAAFVLSSADGATSYPMVVSGDAISGAERVISAGGVVEQVQAAVGEFVVTVNVLLVDGNSISQSTPIQITNSVGSVDSIGRASTSNNVVNFPILVSANEPGYYQVTGTVYDIPTNKPVTYITAQELLQAGNQSIPGKIHGYALSKAQMTGPFELRGVTFMRRSERPGVQEKYGITKDRYELGNIDLSGITGDPYEDPDVEDRLEFLRGIGGA